MSLLPKESLLAIPKPIGDELVLSGGRLSLATQANIFAILLRRKTATRRCHGTPSISINSLHTVGISTNSLFSST